MNGTTHSMKRAFTGFALAAAVAAFVVSPALASGGNSPSLSYTKASSTQTDGYATVLERHFKHEDSLYRRTESAPSQCPCNLGLVGGLRVSIPVAGSSTPVTQTRGDFNWGAAGIGTGAVLGLALIALAVGIATRRAGKDSWNIKKRRRLARWLERAAVPERPFVGRGPRYIVLPSVTVACAPSLRAIAAALRDESVAISVDQLQALKNFVSNGDDSPFFGDDPTAALRQAVRLQHSVVGTEPAALDYEQLAVAV